MSVGAALVHLKATFITENVLTLTSTTSGGPFARAELQKRFEGACRRRGDKLLVYLLRQAELSDDRPKYGRVPIGPSLHVGLQQIYGSCVQRR